MALAEAALFEWDDAVLWNDERNEYGEVRRCAIGYIGNRLHYLVYVLRGNVVASSACARHIHER